MLMAHRLAQRAEEEFQATLAEKDLKFRSIECQIAQYVSSFFG